MSYWYPVAAAAVGGAVIIVAYILVLTGTL